MWNGWFSYRAEHQSSFRIHKNFYSWPKCKNTPDNIPSYKNRHAHFDKIALYHSVPFGFNLGSNQSCSKLFMLNDMVMDGDVHVVKDVKSILFIKVRLQNKTKTNGFKAQTG